MSIKPESGAESGSGGGWEKNNLMPVWEQRAHKIHAKILVILQANPGMSYADASKQAAEQNPELFNAKDDSPAKAAASLKVLVAQTRALAIDEVVKGIQAGTELSYDEAWRIAQAKHANLFRG